jgi:hypothetical protein
MAEMQIQGHKKANITQVQAKSSSGALEDSSCCAFRLFRATLAAILILNTYMDCPCSFHIFVPKNLPVTEFVLPIIPVAGVLPLFIISPGLGYYCIPLSPAFVLQPCFQSESSYVVAGCFSSPYISR